MPEFAVDQFLRRKDLQLYNLEHYTITQLIDVVYENPINEGEHDQYNISVSNITSAERSNNCMTQ